MDWTTALVSLGSALLGAVVGSGLTILAGRLQAKDDRAEARRERSEHAAQEIVYAMFALTRKVSDAIANRSPAQLSAVVDDFTQAVGPPSMLISDEDVSRRLLDFWEVTRRFVSAPLPSALVDVWVEHSDVVRLSLEAHITGKPLPDYRPPQFLA